jgi:hypothetical protein
MQSVDAATIIASSLLICLKAGLEANHFNVAMGCISEGGAQ